jgi:CheY-like chemotaxis protein
VRISVIDNGNGMDGSLVPHVFDLFTQGARDLDRSQGGLGIGLALVKAIVTLHGGHVTAFSEGPGKGSTFSVALPEAAHDRLHAAHQQDKPGRMNSLRVMVVDDNFDAAHSLAVLLQAIGHHVTVKTNAKSALDEAMINPPHAFILDIGLPDMSGYDLARQLRKVGNCSNTTLIALTGYGQPQDREMSHAAGFDHHFVKPADTQLLIKVLSEPRGTELA